jgi:hypothetical protein
MPIMAATIPGCNPGLKLTRKKPRQFILRQDLQPVSIQYCK